VESDDGLPSRPLLVGSEYVEYDVARDGDDITAIADQRATSTIERNQTVTSRHHCAKPFASKQRGGFQRQGLQSRPPVPGIHVTASEATSAMISITATTSMSVKPAASSALHVRDVGGNARAAFPAV
jgi:hypothetical protein